MLNMLVNLSFSRIYNPQDQEKVKFSINLDKDSVLKLIENL